MKKKGKVNAMPNPQKKEFNLKYNFFPPKMARVRDFLTFYFRNNFTIISFKKYIFFL